MLARLKELQPKVLKCYEGEHKYRLDTRSEHCDLWWEDNAENWLEVKTVIFSDQDNNIKYNSIKTDIDKMTNDKNIKGNRYHLSFLYPIEIDQIAGIKDEFKEMPGLTEGEWIRPLNDNKYMLIELLELE